MQLGLVLRGVFCQRLVKRADGQGRCAAIEIMINSPHIKEVIENGATRDLEKAIQEGAHYKMQTFNMSLYNLFKAGAISEEEALACSSAPEDLMLMMRGIQRGTTADEMAATGFAAPAKGATTTKGAPGMATKIGVNITQSAPTKGGMPDKKKPPGRGFNF